MDSITQSRHDENLQRVQTLGSVKLRHEDNKEIILIPTPSDDPNDPLNWYVKPCLLRSTRTCVNRTDRSKPFKVYLMLLTCLILILANFLAVGPSVTIIETTIDLLHATPPIPSVPQTLAPASIAAFTSAVTKMSYVFSGMALMQGFSNLIWMPLIVKYGRRPVYIFSWLGYTIFAVVASRAYNWSILLGSRIVLGFFPGTAECMAPLTIADLTFLHQRGVMMALYAVALGSGGSIGSVIDGALSTTTDWRAIYYLGAGLSGFVTILIFFTFPETAYNRLAAPMKSRVSDGLPEKLEKETNTSINATHVEVEQHVIPPKKSFAQNLKITNGILTQESMFTIFLRPLAMFVLPPVFWATIMLGLHVGFYVVIGNTVATSFTQNYHFSTLQVGLLWFAVIIGSLIGLPLAGWWTDWVADLLTRRNHGIREPEMRLPAMILGMLVAPGGILLYGLGIGYKLHWAAPAFGLLLCKWSLKTCNQCQTSCLTWLQSVLHLLSMVTSLWCTPSMHTAPSPAKLLSHRWV